MKRFPSPLRHVNIGEGYPMTEREIFLAALEFKDPAARARFLQERLPDDESAQKHVADLLSAAEKVEGFLEQSPAATSAYPATELLGSQIGQYKILQKIGEGGMGIVFMAEQLEPIRRKVALKIIKPGMDSRQVIARFEAERQALAMMDHVNIARVIDGGTTDSPLCPPGRGASGEGAPVLPLTKGELEGVDWEKTTPPSLPLVKGGAIPVKGGAIPVLPLTKGELEGVFYPCPYFVMELVHGVPITKYCDDNHLTPRERLELFIPVCQAIQHAHQKGIIHRDIKPSNVLVTLYDGKPVPKVIDFGVAKATDQKLTERTMFTNFGMMVGTLEYMSPEQAEMSALGVDTRSDIYSLGVLLYELLTGSTPLSYQQMKLAAYAEVLRMIKEEEPPKPSTRLSNSGEALASISAQRKTEPAKLAKLVRGELDWIVMKTLEKDRNRRYETANGLARDIARYLADESVEACPPSRGYRLKKFLRRNKAAVMTSIVIVFLLLGGVIGTSLGLWEADHQRDSAIAAFTQETKAKGVAQKRLMQLEKANEIISSIFDDLYIRSTKEEETKPLEVVLAKRLLKSAELLEGDAIGDPVVVAGLRGRFGNSLLNLGFTKEAVRLFEKERDTYLNLLGPDAIDTLLSKSKLAEGYRAMGRWDLALPLFEAVLVPLQRKLGKNNFKTLYTMMHLGLCYHDAGQGKKAIPLLEESLQISKTLRGAEDSYTLSCMNNLAIAYSTTGKEPQAIQMMEDVLRITRAKRGSDHPATISSMNNLASFYQNVGKLDRALELFEQSASLTKKKLGLDHLHTLHGMKNLATAYYLVGQLDRALPMLEETVKLMKEKLGPDHIDTLKGMEGLGQALMDAGQTKQALEILEDVLRRRKAKLGINHEDTLTAMNSVAVAYKQVGKQNEAVSLFEESLKLHREKYGEYHPHTLMNTTNLASAYQAWGKHDLALSMLEKNLKVMQAKLEKNHPATLNCMNNLAACYCALKKLDRSIPLFEQLVSLRQQEPVKNPSKITEALGNLIVNYHDAGRFADAARSADQFVDTFQKLPFGLQGKYAFSFLTYVSESFERAGEPAKAEHLIRLYLSAIREHSGTENPNYAEKLALLGLNLLKQKRWTDAESTLRECLTMREKYQSEGWGTFNTHSLLGGALLGQKEYANAEPHLLKGYEGMKAREQSIGPKGFTRIPEALDRLIQFYTETNKPEEVKKWQEMRAKYPKET
jgi:serine/threonine protein kinase/Tfp pilus assembly protein PilF